MKDVFEGTVGVETVHKGSKSEHQAAVLRTDAEALFLRLNKGNPFETTLDFKDYFNQRVRIEGVRVGSYLIVGQKSDITPQP